MKGRYQSDIKKERGRGTRIIEQCVYILNSSESLPAVCQALFPSRNFHLTRSAHFPFFSSIVH